MTVPATHLKGKTIKKFTGVGGSAEVRERSEGTPDPQLQRLALVASSTANGVFIVDAHDRIEWANDSFALMYGCTAAEVCGRTAAEFLAGTDDDGRQDYRHMREELMQGRACNTEARRRSSRGEQFWVALECRPIMEEGAFAGYICIERNITEWKLSEASLRESEARKSAILESALDCIITMDQEGRILEFNPAAETVFGHAREHAVGRVAASLLLPPYVWEGQVDAVKNLVATGGEVHGQRLELTAMRANGAEFPAELAISVTKFAGKTFFTAYVRDITERKQVEADLRKAKQAAEAANLAKSEFLANVSHEIRTPMNGIIGMTELALQTNLTAEQREYLGLVKASSGSLLTIINDILDFSKIEAGRLDVETIPFSLRESLGDTMKSLAIDAHGKGLELACDISPDMPDALLGDPLRLRQIIINLVGNAIKFTDKGEVVVRIRPQSRDGGDLVCYFTVHDTGVGIPKEKQATIFAPFLQADTSTTRIYGGTGLGLTISARLAEMMGGTIWVESEPGSGSVFHFTARFSLQSTPPRRDPVDFKGLRVLVAEDHPVARRYVMDMLGQWNVKCDEAENGNSAVALIKRASQAQDPYKLVLLDDTLPGVDSYAIASQICKSPHLGIAVVGIFSSALRREGDEERSGAFFCFTKPVKQSELLEVLSAASGPATAAVPLQHAAARSASASRRELDILLVEDNPINRRLAQYVLEKEGHAVVLADNGASAIEALDRRRFDLVLMDVQMPRMDGVETTIAIRSKEKLTGGHIPILALTAHAMARDRERCLQAGMDGYLIKPIQPAMLLESIDRLCAPAEGVQPAAARRVVIDEATLMDRVSGDMDLLQEITGLFRRDSVKLLGELRDAIANRDASRYAYVVHTLKGMFRNLSADAAQQVVERMQELRLDQDGDRIDAARRLLEQEVEALESELIALADQGVHVRGT